jgi:hypothetical protein
MTDSNGFVRKRDPKLILCGWYKGTLGHPCDIDSIITKLFKFASVFHELKIQHNLYRQNFETFIYKLQSA